VGVAVGRLASGRTKRPPRVRHLGTNADGADAAGGSLLAFLPCKESDKGPIRGIRAIRVLVFAGSLLWLRFRLVNEVAGSRFLNAVQGSELSVVVGFVPAQNDAGSRCVD